MSRHIPLAHDQVRQQQQAAATPPTGAPEPVLEAMVEAFECAYKGWGPRDHLQRVRDGLQATLASQAQPSAPGRVEAPVRRKLALMTTAYGRALLMSHVHNRKTFAADLVTDVRTLLVEVERLSALATPSPQDPAPAAEVEVVPVAWQARATAVRSDGKDWPWFYINAEDVPGMKGPNYDLRPLYAHCRPSSRDEPDAALREASVGLVKALDAMWNDPLPRIKALDKHSRAITLRHGEVKAALARLAPSEPGNDVRGRS